MNVFLILFFFLAVGFNAYSQTPGTFEVSAGMRYRTPPLDVGQDSSGTKIMQNPIILARDQHLSGFSFSIGINYFPVRDFCLRYEGYVRYDDFLTTIDSANMAQTENKKLMFDHQAALLYNFIKPGGVIISSGIGFSLNNSNTKYSFSRLVHDPRAANGYVMTAGNDNCRFTTLDLPIYIKLENKVELGLKTSYTLQHKFSFFPNKLLLFSLTARYNFRLNNKS